MRFRTINTRRALEYIRKELQGGSSLSQRLLTRLEQQQVRAGTWVPLGLSKEEVYRFEQGGKLPSGDEVIRLSGGVLVPIPNTAAEVARYIYRKFSLSTRRGVCPLLLAPNELASPSDPWIARYRPPLGTGIVCWQNEVYFYAESSASVIGIEAVIRRARLLSGKSSVAVFAEGINVRESWSPDMVASFAKFFIAEAYDHESFLLVRF